jgi:hypothetical protein
VPRWIKCVAVVCLLVGYGGIMAGWSHNLIFMLLTMERQLVLLWSFTELVRELWRQRHQVHDHQE